VSGDEAQGAGIFCERLEGEGIKIEKSFLVWPENANWAKTASLRFVQTKFANCSCDTMTQFKSTP
jgi:hypothetical protein